MGDGETTETERLRACCMGKTTWVLRPGNCESQVWSPHLCGAVVCALDSHVGCLCTPSPPNEAAQTVHRTTSSCKDRALWGGPCIDTSQLGGSQEVPYIACLLDPSFFLHTVERLMCLFFSSAFVSLLCTCASGHTAFMDQGRSHIRIKMYACLLWHSYPNSVISDGMLSLLRRCSEHVYFG